MSENKRMYDNHKEHGEDLSYENEQSMVTIPLREYDKLKEQGQYITDPALISIMILCLILFCDSNLKKINNNIVYVFFFLAVAFNLLKNIDRIVDKNLINNPYFEINSKISKPVKKNIDNFTYYIGWYGETPIGNRDLNNKKHKKILIFNIIN